MLYIYSIAFYKLEIKSTENYQIFITKKKVHAKFAKFLSAKVNPRKNQVCKNKSQLFPPPHTEINTHIHIRYARKSMI